MTIGKIEDPLFPKRDNFIPKGQWNDDKVQKQILEVTSWSVGENNTEKTCYTCPANKVFFLTGISGDGDLGEIEWIKAKDARIVNDGGAISPPLSIWPSIKLKAGETVKAKTTNQNPSTPFYITVWGMEEPP
jgi:hypothetical protein